MHFVSCPFILHGISFTPYQIDVCCLCTHAGGGRLVLKENYNGEILNWDEIFEEKEKLIQENLDGKVNPKCEGCFWMCEDNYDDYNERHFDYLHFTHWTKCNCDCIYCYTRENKEYLNTRKTFNVLPVIKDLESKNLLKLKNVTFAGGEPTVLNEFEELLDLLINNINGVITVNTNGIIYSKAIEKGIQKGCVEVITSPDSGCSETYQRIKHSNTYDRVINNLKSYVAQEDKSKPPLVSSKFVFVPEYNDNFDEITKWINTAKEIGVRKLIVDIEFSWYYKQREKNALPKHVKELIKYIEYSAKNLGMEMMYFGPAFYYSVHKDEYLNNDYVEYKYE